MDDQQPARAPASKSAAVVFQGLSKLAGLVLQFFLYRYCILMLGGGPYGTFVFALSCAAFLGLADLGLPAATQVYLGEALAKGDLERAAVVFRFARRMHTLFAAGAALIFAAFALLYDVALRQPNSHPHGVLLVLCGLQTASMIFMSPSITLAYALGRFREVAWINFVQGTVTPLLGIAIIYFKQTPEALALSFLLGAVLSVVLALRLSGAHALPRVKETLPEEDQKKLFGLSVRGFPTSVTTAIGGNADKVLIHQVGPGGLGSYYVAGRAPETVFQIIFPLAQTVYPELTRLAKSDPDAFNRVVERNTRFALALAAGLIIVPSAFSESILRFWLHNSFVDANPGVTLVLPLMAIYRGLELVYAVTAMAFFAKGVPQYGLPFAVFNALVTLVATVPMYRWQGIAGVALMNALIDVAQIVPIILVLRRFAAPGLRLGHMVGGFAGTLALSGLLFVLFHFAIDRPLSHSVPAIGFFAAPIAAVAAIALMVRLRICEVPESAAARLKRWPLGQLVLGIPR